MTENRKPTPITVSDLNRVLKNIWKNEFQELWIPPDVEYSKYQESQDEYSAKILWDTEFTWNGKEARFKSSDGKLYFGSAINTTCTEVTKPIGELERGGDGRDTV